MISGCQRLGARTWIGGIQRIFRAEKILYDIITVDTCHDTFVQNSRMYITKVNPRVICDLWVIIMCQCRFKNRNKCTTPVSEVNNVGCACFEAGGIWKISLSWSQFCCERTTPLKIQSLKKKTQYKIQTKTLKF